MRAACWERSRDQTSASFSRFLVTSTNLEMVIQAAVRRDDGAERLTSHLQRSNVMNATRYLPFAGRLLIGLPFAMSGLSKLAAYGPTTEMIGAVGLPAPSLAFAVAVVVELGGGLLLIAGFQARLVAIALALFCLATAVSFHANFGDQNQMIHFLKNIMIAGGLLQIAGFGAGAISVDNRLSKGGEAVANVAAAR